MISEEAADHSYGGYRDSLTECLEYGHKRAFAPLRSLARRARETLISRGIIEPAYENFGDSDEEGFDEDEDE